MPLTNSQFDSIMERYLERRLANTQAWEARRDEVYREIPEMNELDGAIRSASLDAARARLSGEADADGKSGALRRLIGEQKARRALLLQEHGYPADYLDPIYTCPVCQDTGYVDGKRCACFKKESTRLLLHESNLEDILKSENFGAFSMKWYSADPSLGRGGKSPYDLMTDNVASANMFIDTFGAEFHNLFLYGATGLGKTFLSHCIAKELIDRGQFVIYLTASEFAETVSARRFSDDAAADELYRRALSADLVILDDVGTEVPNSFTASALFTFLNSRINAEEPVVISTNLTLEQFKETYGERIFSRIMSCYTFLPFAGEDIRRQKRLVTS